MSDLAIKVEHVYKQYKLGLVNTGTLVHDINRWWHKINGKQDPYEILTGENDRTRKTSNDYVWALNDINFDVVSGEVLGIIGKNGAGKSTLLKILSRVTTPTKGKVKVKGRIASLLEVGTGFHPELTGRENIFLNGAILGMTKTEIRSKFDEIVAFSGVEKYIDTPVKRYSSGMYVRLAFAVAAHLEPEILIVDEVLAVGDADFQKKCLGKMKDVSGEGRTVLFVSHNMAAVKSLCSRAMLLKNGEVSVLGSTNDVVKEYFGIDKDSFNFRVSNQKKDGFCLVSVGVKNSDKTYEDEITRDKEMIILFEYKMEEEKNGLYFNIKLKDEEGGYILTTASLGEVEIDKSSNFVKMIIPRGFFNEGSYYLDLMVMQKNDKAYHVFFNEPDFLSFNILPEERPLGTWMGKELGFIRHTFEWKK
jgi:lipopolysaccharide transport system ATP-binding protein